MQNHQLIQRIRDFISKEHKSGKTLITYQRNPDFPDFLRNYEIGVELDHFKEIILQEETGLELGGLNKKSFSLIFPLTDLELIEKGKITILGHEINTIKEKSVDFSLFLLIGINKNLEKDIEKLRQLNFISNGIEGFLIRTIPRRFWCRISSDAIEKKFSFEFLGNAIHHLFRQKFGNLIKSIEIIFINSYPDAIDQFREASSEIMTQIKKRWRDKIEEWKKNIDCDYDWGCEICPYQEECYNVKQVLVSREDI